MKTGWFNIPSYEELVVSRHACERHFNRERSLIPDCSLEFLISYLTFFFLRRAPVPFECANFATWSLERCLI